MNKEEMDNLRDDIYKMWSDCKNPEEKEVFSRVLLLINEVANMRHTLETITEIGSDHCT